MCAKKEPHEVYQALVDIDQEFSTYEETRGLLPTLAWAGVTVYYGLLENV